jgi:hypothetical protein
VAKPARKRPSSAASAETSVRYSDGRLLSRCIRGGAAHQGRGKVFALDIIMCFFCNWDADEVGAQNGRDPARGPAAGSVAVTIGPSSTTTMMMIPTEQHSWRPSSRTGRSEKKGPSISVKRKELQVMYARSRASAADEYVKWTADVVRLVLHPITLRSLVDVVHYPWSRELGHVDYCA